MAKLEKSDLPDFDNPPVVETVLSAQFDKIVEMHFVHFALFWQRVRDRFPTTQDHPALPSVTEQATEPSAQAVQIRFEAHSTLSLQRLWLVNETATEIMQIQSDKFIKNWRKVGSDAEYPRYERSIKPGFERDFGEFQKFLSDEQLGKAVVNQCEVTYVNHIVAGEGWDSWDEIEKIFTFVKQPTNSLPGNAEDIAFRTRFPIFGPKNEWIGRLHVDVQPAVNLVNNKAMYVMNLTARGMYGSGVDFFDIGRRWIVKSFETLTTAHMHKIWRRKN